MEARTRCGCHRCFLHSRNVRGTDRTSEQPSRGVGRRCCFKLQISLSLSLSPPLFLSSPHPTPRGTLRCTVFSSKRVVSVPFVHSLSPTLQQFHPRSSRGDKERSRRRSIERNQRINIPGDLLAARFLSAPTHPPQSSLTSSAQCTPRVSLAPQRTRA